MNSFLLLAGGASSRMGEPKGLVKFQGSTWLEWQLKIISTYQQESSFGITEVLIVLGYHLNAYLNLLIPLNCKLNDELSKKGAAIRNLNQQPYFRIVNNPQPERGSFSSLQCGLKEKAEQNTGVFVLPIDVPAPDINVIGQMLTATSKSEVVIPTVQFENYEKGGHPVWLAQPIIRKILLADVELPESRLDFIIKQLPNEDIARIRVTDPNVIRNLNSPNDLAYYERHL